jgi:hypothetical protein
MAKRAVMTANWLLAENKIRGTGESRVSLSSGCHYFSVFGVVPGLNISSDTGYIVTFRSFRQFLQVIVGYLKSATTASTQTLTVSFPVSISLSGIGYNLVE